MPGKPGEGSLDRSAPAPRMRRGNGGTLAELMFAQREVQVVCKKMPLLPEMGQEARDAWGKGNNGARHAERQAWPFPPSLCGPVALLGPNLRLVSALLRTTPFCTEAAALALTEDSSKGTGS